MTQSEKAKQYRNTKIGRAKSLLYGYIREDKINNRGECKITEDDIIKLWNDGCFCCKETDWHKLGVDRIDNTKPHTIDNVRCSCWSCNSKGGGGLNKRPVVQYTKYGEFIREYKSISEAQNKTGIKSICQCCKGKYKTAGGYIWKYK